MEQGRLHQGSQPTIKQVRILLEASHRPNISLYDRGEAVCGLDVHVSKKADSFIYNKKNFLVPQYPQAARFYLLPKIHKPGNLGRHIVASNGAPTKISCFADFFLCPALSNYHHTSGTPWTSSINYGGYPDCPPGCLLLTLDVSSLQ